MYLKTLLSFIHSFTHSFIHSSHFYIASSSPLIRGAPGLLHGYCIGVSRRSAQETVRKGLAQGPYVAARAEVEPTILRLRVIDLTNAPPRPTASNKKIQSTMSVSRPTSSNLNLSVNR